MRRQRIDEFGKADLVLQQRGDVVEQNPGLGKSGTVRTSAFKASTSMGLICSLMRPSTPESVLRRICGKRTGGDRFVFPTDYRGRQGSDQFSVLSCQ
jgi:hypothetical protein